MNFLLTPSSQLRRGSLHRLSLALQEPSGFCLWIGNTWSTATACHLQAVQEASYTPSSQWGGNSQHSLHPELIGATEEAPGHHLRSRWDRTWGSRYWDILSLRSLGTQTAGVLPEPRTWADSGWSECQAAMGPVPCGVVSTCRGSWPPSSAPWQGRRAAPGSQRQPQYNIAWGKTYQSSNSTQEEGSSPTICAKGNPVIQWWGNSLMDPQEAQAPASDNRTK